MTDATASRSTPGRVVAPGDTEYDTARTPWNLSIDQRPAFVVQAQTTDDVQGAVRFAADRDLPVAVQSSGHGIVHPCDGGVLVDVSRLTSVEVDPTTQTARFGAGARWRTVLEAAGPHGLAGLSGTAPSVGAVGYTLGGGLGLLLRTFGFAADSIVGGDVVTADGSVVHADDEHDPDLLWALKGAGGNNGIVTSLDVRLFPVPEVVNGMLAYSGDRAADVLGHWQDWTQEVPDEVTSAAMLAVVPPAPAIPEPLRGRHVVIVRATVAGGDPASIDALRSRLGDPVMDTFRSSSYLEAALSGMEPDQPSRSAGRSALMNTLSDATIQHLVAAARPGAPIMPLEIRHLGGCAARDPERPSPVSHRDASYIVAMHAAPEDDAAQAAVEAHMDEVVTGLALDRHPGALVNFLHPRSTADQVRAAYSNEAYARLQTIKRTYDPANTFRFNHNIAPAAG